MELNWQHWVLAGMSGLLAFLLKILGDRYWKLEKRVKNLEKRNPH